MPSEFFELLHDAIANRENVSAEYDGYDREMTPHTLGFKNGREQCLFYQFGGNSSSSSHFPQNDPRNWRCMEVSRLRNLEVVEGLPQTCDRHSQPQTCVDDVEIEIDFRNSEDS